MKNLWIIFWMIYLVGRVCHGQGAPVWLSNSVVITGTPSTGPGAPVWLTKPVTIANPTSTPGPTATPFAGGASNFGTTGATITGPVSIIGALTATTLGIPGATGVFETDGFGNMVFSGSLAVYGVLQPDSGIEIYGNPILEIYGGTAGETDFPEGPVSIGGYISTSAPATVGSFMVLSSGITIATNPITVLQTNLTPVVLNYH